VQADPQRRASFVVIPLSLHFTTKASLRWGQLHRALGFKKEK